MITPFMLRYRPDQTAQTLNGIVSRLDSLESSIMVVSKDKKQAIVIGNQPTNPETGKPYEFGIRTYRIKGDRLEEI